MLAVWSQNVEESLWAKHRFPKMIRSSLFLKIEISSQDCDAYRWYIWSSGRKNSPEASSETTTTTTKKRRFRSGKYKLDWCDLTRINCKRQLRIWHEMQQPKKRRYAHRPKLRWWCNNCYPFLQMRQEEKEYGSTIIFLLMLPTCIRKDK